MANEVVVLAHGYLAFQQLGRIRYFRGLRAHLKRILPNLTIIQVQVTPAASIADRAAELAYRIEQSLVAGQQAHFVGHSMGGLDGRYLASPEGLGRTDLICSLTTIGSPHWGSPLADRALDRYRALQSSPVGQRIEGRIAKGRERVDIESSHLRWWLMNALSLSDGGLEEITPSAMRRFSETITNPPSMPTYSFGGVCGPGEKARLPTVLWLPWRIIRRHADPQAGGRNDGLVALESTKWGDYWGVLEADHAIQVGWDLTAKGSLSTSLGQPRFDHLAFFSDWLRRLLHGEADRHPALAPLP